MLVHVWIPVEADGTHPPFDVEYVSLSDGAPASLRRVPRNDDVRLAAADRESGGVAAAAAGRRRVRRGGGTLGTWGVIVTTEALVSAASSRSPAHHGNAPVRARPR